MFGKLFIVFAVLPILEIMLLINVSDNIGGWNTFILVLITAFLGAYFVRREGAQTLTNVQLKLSQGEMPGKEMSEGVLLLIAGVLLVTPGFITDCIGLLFTLPMTRAPIAKRLLLAFAQSDKSNVHFSAHGFSKTGPHNSAHEQDSNQTSGDKGEVIDGEYTDTSEGATHNKLSKDPKIDDKNGLN